MLKICSMYIYIYIYIYIMYILGGGLSLVEHVIFCHKRNGSSRYKKTGDRASDCRYMKNPPLPWPILLCHRRKEKRAGIETTHGLLLSRCQRISMQCCCIYKSIGYPHKISSAKVPSLGTRHKLLPQVLRS